MDPRLQLRSVEPGHALQRVVWGHAGNATGEYTTEAELRRLTGIHTALPTTLEQDLQLLQGQGVRIGALSKISRVGIFPQNPAACLE